MKVDNVKIKQICIVGGGTAGWMTAAGLSHKFKNLNININLVESDQIGTVGVGEATLPAIRFFNNTLGINEAEFMKATSATFKLGIEFCDWGQIGDSYIHPFGDYGQPIKHVDFYHFWLRLCRLGNSCRLDDYSYPIITAEMGKFRFPDTDKTKIESTLGYAYQFDSGLYAKFLRRFAEAHGVKRTEGKITHATQHPQTGFVESVTLDNGATIEADLFIDCSGFRGLLIEQTLKTGYTPWDHWLPCDRALAVPSESAGPLLPYTRATARKAGWQWRIPLQHRTGNGLVYWSEHISDDEAAHQLMSTLDAPTLADPKQLYFKTGVRKRFWNKNVISIGLSAGFLEPLESTSIYLIQEGITVLLELFPESRFDVANTALYNDTMSLYFDRVRDFLLLHYVATQRDDSEMWRHFQTLELPESLQARIDAWLTRGYIRRYDKGAFLPPSWIAVMLGQNLVPRGYDLRADSLSEAELVSHCAALREATHLAARNTPDHASALASFGAAIS